MKIAIFYNVWYFYKLVWLYPFNTANNYWEHISIDKWLYNANLYVSAFIFSFSLSYWELETYQNCVYKMLCTYVPNYVLPMETLDTLDYLSPINSSLLRNFFTFFHSLYVTFLVYQTNSLLACLSWQYHFCFRCIFYAHMYIGVYASA